MKKQYTTPTITTLDISVESQILAQCLAAGAQLTCKGCGLFLISAEGGQFRFPGLIGGIHIFRCPGVFLGDFAAKGDLLDFFHGFTS